MTELVSRFVHKLPVVSRSLLYTKHGRDILVRVSRRVRWIRARIQAWLIVRRYMRRPAARFIFAARNAANTDTAPPPSGVGALFGLPGLTQWTEQKDNNDQATVVPSAGSTVPASTLVEFKQTDVVFWWEIEYTWTTGLTISNANTVFTSPYYPFNIQGDSRLQIQNMYASWHAISGIDAALWQMIRPMRNPGLGLTGNMGANPSPFWANPYTAQQPADAEATEDILFQQSLSPALVAANTTAEQTFNITTPGVVFDANSVLVSVNKPSQQAGLAVASGRVSAANQVALTFVNDTAAGITPTATENYTFIVRRAGDLNGAATGRATVTFSLEIPVSLPFDLYYDLTKDGTIVSPPLRAIVSPQYMAGSARVIQPQININPTLAANNDQGPFVTNAGAPTVVSPSITLGFKRVGVYAANNAALMPVVYNWQYVRDTKQFSIAGRATFDILVPVYGQILSIFLRFFDPSATSGGQPINILSASVGLSKIQLQFGSGLLRFDDTARTAQRRFFKQHGFLPPQGVVIWDLAQDVYGRTTNAYALNTLTTAGVNIHGELLSAASSTAYIVVGIEALTYVE